MKVYYSNNQGCGIWFFVILVLMFMMMGAFFKFLFTTPIGLVLLILGIIYYWVRKYQNRNGTSYEGHEYGNQNFGQGYSDIRNTSEVRNASEVQNGSEKGDISRDAEDVVYYEADDNTDE